LPGGVGGGLDRRRLRLVGEDVLQHDAAGAEDEEEDEGGEKDQEAVVHGALAGRFGGPSVALEG
jgi:hypothetical protein